MPLTMPIPIEAMPVVEILRREVARPSELPKIRQSGMQWELQFNAGGFSIDCCALGLAPKATSPNPGGSHSFGYDVSDREVEAFYRWFDKQTDPQATVDAIWPVTSSWELRSWECDCSQGDTQCQAMHGELCCRYRVGHPGKHKTCYNEGSEWIDEVTSSNN